MISLYSSSLFACCQPSMTTWRHKGGRQLAMPTARIEVSIAWKPWLIQFTKIIGMLSSMVTICSGRQNCAHFVSNFVKCLSPGLISATVAARAYWSGSSCKRLMPLPRLGRVFTPDTTKIGTLSARACAIALRVLVSPRPLMTKATAGLPQNRA